MSRPRGRGGWWVAVQIALIAAVAVSALTGSGWPHRLEVPAYVVGGALLVLGAGLLAAGGNALTRVRAITPFPAPRPGGSLQTGGVYRLVRHPIYGGGITAALGWSIVFATALGAALTVGLAAFAYLKSWREERWLETAFGEYASYRDRTPRRFIPFLW